MNAIMPASACSSVFDFEGNKIRIISRDGDPWFVALDVCRALGIVNVARATDPLAARHKGIHQMNTLGGLQAVTIISESGLYRLVLRSDKPQALPFQDWVTCEVLPAIRRTGGYSVSASRESEEELVLRAMQAMQAKVDRQRAQLVVAEARAETAESAALESEAALEDLAGTEGTYSMRDAAKVLKVRPFDFYPYLEAHRWIFRAADGWSAVSDRVRRGHLAMKAITFPGKGHRLRTRQQVLVTNRGLVLLRKQLGKSED